MDELLKRISNMSEEDIIKSIMILDAISESLESKIDYWSNIENWNNTAVMNTQVLVLGELQSLLGYIKEKNVN